jgi:molecular chaperone GrpE (heat shock protein)
MKSGFRWHYPIVSLGFTLGNPGRTNQEKVGKPTTKWAVLTAAWLRQGIPSKKFSKFLESSFRSLFAKYFQIHPPDRGCFERFSLLKFWFFACAEAFRGCGEFFPRIGRFMSADTPTSSDSADELPLGFQVDSRVQKLFQLQALLDSNLAELRNLSIDMRQAHLEIERCRKSTNSSIRPLLNEMLSIRDDLSRLIEFYSQSERVDSKDVVANLDGIRTELDEVLSRREIVPIQLTSPKYDRDTQRAVYVAPANHPDQDLTVVSEVRTGFQGPDGVLRRTDVSILRFAPPENT